MTSTQKIIERISVKQTCIRAICTRLKPNVYIEKHSYWKELSEGLERMNVDQINALEALIMGYKLRHLPDE